MTSTHDRLQQTRASWNVATRQHNAHKRSQAAWLQQHSTLYPEERALVGDVLGKRLLHTLCNSGQDSLSWAKEGADVVGVDLADEPVAFATQLARDAHIPARFVCSEVVTFLEATSERFDVVFGSYGCLTWIENLPQFFAGVRRVLVDGGRAVFMEFHPIVWSFDAAFTATKDPYFASEPFSAPVLDYVGAAGGALSPSGHVDVIDEPLDNPHVAHAWQHTTANIVNAVLRSGLHLQQLQEYPHSNGCKVIDGLVLDDSGTRWCMPPAHAALPLMLGVVAGR
jgi:SAM-dependent methyltransferase